MYNSALQNVKGGVVLPPMADFTADSRLKGAIFDKLYEAQENPMMVEDNSDEDETKSQASRNLSGFEVGSQLSHADRA